MVIKTFFSMLGEAGKDWADDNASRLGAALAYYSLFSLGPLLLIALAIASSLFGEQAVSQELFLKLRSFIGDAGAEALQQLLANTQKTNMDGIAGLVGGGTLIFAATGVIVQLKDAFNAIWEVEPDEGKGLFLFLKKYIISLAAVLGLGFLLMISMVVTSLVTATSGAINNTFPLPDAILLAINLCADFFIITLIFALMFKYLPDVEVRLHDVMVGAVFTSCLFLIGKYLIGLYLGRQALESSYGAAGSIILVLIWIYYSSQILFFGAEFTQVYVTRMNHVVRPQKGAHLAAQGKMKSPADSTESTQSSPLQV